MMEVDFATELARLRSPGGEIDLTARPVASGFQYSGGGHDLRGKEHELRWTLPSGEVQPYTVFLVNKDGSTTPFSEYGR